MDSTFEVESISTLFLFSKLNLGRKFTSKIQFWKEGVLKGGENTEQSSIPRQRGTFFLSSPS
jgi:hypothetical protein